MKNKEQIYAFWQDFISDVWSGVISPFQQGLVCNMA